ncbi:ribosomal protein L24p/L26e, archaeal [Thermoplasmatales archaeon BRNA1]|nr:ribosomal protein L24p/L26e, archaeal [Thermoplasmatales archaeon BRNA1]
MSDTTGGPTFSGDSGIKEVHAGKAVKWDFEVSAGAAKADFEFSVVASDPDMGPEWSITLFDSVGSILWDNFRSKPKVTVDFPGKSGKLLTLEVICPKGARYDESVNIEITAKSDAGEASQHFGAAARQSIVILKTQMDQEKVVVQSLIAKADQGEKDIYAVLSPAGMRGYVFVEGMNTDRMHEKTRDIKKARAFIDGEVSIEEISNYLYPVSAVIGIEEGDIVELVNGPFKGEKARVTKIDETKEEITVELVDAMVPIPVTVKGDSVRLIEKEN